MLVQLDTPSQYPSASHCPYQCPYELIILSAPLSTPYQHPLPIYPPYHLPLSPPSPTLLPPLNTPLNPPITPPYPPSHPPYPTLSPHLLRSSIDHQRRHNMDPSPCLCVSRHRAHFIQRPVPALETLGPRGVSVDVGIPHPGYHTHTLSPSCHTKTSYHITPCHTKTSYHSVQQHHTIIHSTTISSYHTTPVIPKHPTNPPTHPPH